MSTKRRIIEIFSKLLGHEKMSTKEIAEKYHLSQRTAQRDIRDVTDALETIYPNKKLKKNTSDHTYEIENLSGLENKNVYVILKILLASRALNKEEMHDIIHQLLSLFSGDEHRQLKESILNELTFMTSIDDKQSRTKKLWQLEMYIQNSSVIAFNYINHETSESPTTEFVALQPSTIFFDNFYFFLVGLEKESKKYVTYRIDWMENITSTKQKKKIDYRSRYEHGLKRPITVYAYSGKKEQIQFEYYGFVEYVKDRFPSCKIIKQLDKKSEWPFSVNLLQIEVEYSWGVKLWILGDSGNIRVTSPKYIVEDIETFLLKTYQRYQYI